VPSPKRAFDRAFADMCAAADFEAAEDHLGHALCDLYSLYELAKLSPSSQKRRRAALEASPAGRAALAIAWVRKFHTHHLIEVSKAAAVYSGYYTNLYGVLVWRDRADITIIEDDEGRRHEFYDAELAGKPVLDTLQQAVAAVVAVAATNGNPRQRDIGADTSCVTRRTPRVQDF
jgi:hypothetical protein